MIVDKQPEDGAVVSLKAQLGVTLIRGDNMRVARLAPGVEQSLILRCLTEPKPFQDLKALQ